VEQTREPGARRSPPPPLEANDQLVTRVITAGWAVALVVLLIIRGSLRADVRWWIWTCVAGLALGLFGLWYMPDQSAPRDNGSKTVSSTDTPGKSTRS
jgi:4-amino-4-deoxy-L-arabinose transferase-like glycosyltransferase